MLLVLAMVLWSVWLLAIPLVLGSLLATVLAPVSDRLNRRGLPAPISAATVLGSVAVAAGSVAVFAAPVVYDQWSHFHSHARAYLADIEHRLQGLTDLLSRLLPSGEIARQKALLLHRLTTDNRLFDSFQDLFGLFPLLEKAVLSLVVAFFLLSRGTEIRRFLVDLIPNRYFEMSLRLLYRVQDQTAAYVRGQSLDSLVNAILISSALWLLNVPYSMVIGLFAGIANVVPVVGPLSGGAVAVALCLVGATTTPWWIVAIALFAIHMLDNFFIYPRTVGGSLDLPPWVVILGLAVGGQTAGILGMLLAVPLIGLLRGLVIELYESLKGYRIL